MFSKSPFFYTVNETYKYNVMAQDLDSYPLSPKQLRVLKNAGFTQNVDVIELSPSQLSEGIFILNQNFRLI